MALTLAGVTQFASGFSGCGCSWREHQRGEAYDGTSAEMPS
jgi:hypothetical protein